MRTKPSAVTQAIRSLRGGFIAIGLFSFAINVLMLAGPLYMLQVYDRVLTSKSSETLIALSILVAGVFVVSGLLDFIRVRILNRLGARFEEKASGPIFDSVMRRKVAGRASPGDNMMSDLNSFRDFLSGNTLIAFFDSPWVPIYLFVLFVLHPYLGLLGTFGAIVLFILAFMNDRLSRAPIQETAAGRQQADGLFSVCERNAETMVAMGMNTDLRHRWSFFQAITNASKTKATDRVATFSVISKTFRLGIQSAMLGLGAALAISGESSPGIMIAATILLSRALSPVDQAIGQWRIFNAALGSYGKLKKLVVEHPAREQMMTFPNTSQEVKVTIAQAGAPTASKAAISGINFNLVASDVVAVIGPSGSGKSTLARMLAGIWHPQRGEVSLGGIATTLWNNQDLGSQVGYLPQEIELFEGTVRENIARFSEHADDAGILRAAQDADVHNMILRMSDGYDTMVGPGGQFLSGGERQRIGLARALYGDPFLLVLDEPNANLDATGDSALRNAVKATKERGAIVVVVTHRPSTLETVNKVLVLEDGKQRSFGLKQEVLRTTVKPVLPKTNSSTETPKLNERAQS